MSRQQLGQPQATSAGPGVATQASKGAGQKYSATHGQLSDEHMRVGITQRYSMVKAWYSAQKPVWQSSQLGSVALLRAMEDAPPAVL